MAKINNRIKKALCNEKGDITVFTCFFIVGIIMLISFLLTFASVQINTINIRNSIRMELNNLAAGLYSDTFRSQREANFDEYLRTLYSSTAHVNQLEQSVRDGLALRIPLSTNSYIIRNITMEFNYAGGRVEYALTAEVDFFISMFGNRSRVTTQHIRINGHHNAKF